ncbi:amidase [Agrobacterium sp. NPDC090273]|uniref:amidase n=1 Tax=Agrobacterium sp. NPDC090273 TaxID=3363919 RepID=UPI00383B1B4A
MASYEYTYQPTRFEQFIWRRHKAEVGMAQLQKNWEKHVIENPTKADFERIASLYGLNLSEREKDTYLASAAKSVQSYNRILQKYAPLRATTTSKTLGYRPSGKENSFGAWAWKGSIKSANEGLLSGKRIVVKDNVAVAGMPMENGSNLLKGYCPSANATVIDRILAAGGEIVGKAVNEDLCFSGGSHTSKPSPVLNPRNPRHMSGGSSSGCGALLAAGECDMAVGGDQGGSIRIPSAWCGVIGLKPTWGLVPYTGAFPIEPTLDHLGPMANTVEEIARLLTVMAGPDGIDARQHSLGAALPDYMAAITTSAAGLKVGVLEEGFRDSSGDPAVYQLVNRAIEKIKSLGCSAHHVSIPMHMDGIDVWGMIATEGAWGVMLEQNTVALGTNGTHDIDLVNTYARAKQENADEMSPTVKSVALLGKYLSERHNTSLYAFAQNLRFKLLRAYDDVFKDVDILVMPTITRTAYPHDFDADESFVLDNALTMMHNTAVFDVTGHPALSIPCGTIGDLPVGMMLVSKKFEEHKLLTLAQAFQNEPD